MLLILIKQIAENFLVQKGDSLKVVSTSGLEADNFINEPIRLVGEVCDILLPLHLLFDIGRIVTNLEFNGV